MNILLGAICRAGLNRGVIRDALYDVESYKGVTGEMMFDPNAKNIAPLYLGKVHDGQWTYRRYTMQKPYATVGAAGVEYNGPGSSIDSRRAAQDRPVRPGRRGAGPRLEPHRLPGGRRLLRTAWGKASDELVKLVYDPDVIGIVATDRASAHLAEQIAVKTLDPGGGHLRRPHADVGQHAVDLPPRSRHAAGGCHPLPHRCRFPVWRESRIDPRKSGFRNDRGRAIFFRLHRGGPFAGYSALNSFIISNIGADSNSTGRRGRRSSIVTDRLTINRPRHTIETHFEYQISGSF